MNNNNNSNNSTNRMEQNKIKRFSSAKEYLEDLGMGKTGLYYYHLNIEDNQKAFWMACWHENNLDQFKNIIKITEATKPNDYQKSYQNYGCGYEIACAHNKNTEIIAYMLDNKMISQECESFYKFKGYISACKYNNLEVVKFLITRGGFDPHNRNSDGKNAFLIACEWNKDLKVIEYLIKNVKININVGEMLDVVVCNPNCAKYLIESKYYLLINNGRLNERNVQQKKQKLENKSLFQTIVDNKFQGYSKNDYLVRQLSYKEILYLAKNGMIIEPEKDSNVISYILPFRDKIPEDGFTQYPKDNISNIIFKVNDITYYGYKQLVFCQSQTLMNFASMSEKDDVVEINQPTISQQLVEIYLRTFYTGNFFEIYRLDVSELIELCKFVDKYPSKILNIENLEQSLIQTYTLRYKEYYMSLVERYKLYFLLKKVYHCL